MKTFLRGNESLHEPNPYKRVWARAERKLVEGCKTVGFNMKRSSRRWKKKRQMRWKWQRSRIRKEKRKRKLKRARSK